MRLKRNPERGSALVPAVVFAMTVMAYAASVVASGSALLHQTRAHAATQEAQQAAESGVHYVIAKLGGPDRPGILAAGGVKGVLRGSGASAPRFAVAVRPAGDDLADNDLDGLVDEEDEADIVEVTSVGSYDGHERAVYVTLLARYRTPGVGSAVYVADPGAFLDLDGNAFLISGFDVGLTGVPTGEAVPGIGVNGDPNGIRNQVKGKAEARVIGEGISPSVLEVPPLDLQALVEEGARSANVLLEPGEVNKPAEEGEWGSLDEPAVVYSSGSVKVSGGAAGAGAFIVNGDLTITGGFEWRGLIIVRGRVIFKGGGGGKRLIGALVVENAVSGEQSIEGLRVTGTVDIIFSREISEGIGRVLSSYTILNWREGPVTGVLP